jgi:hypothetical protein
VGFIFASAMVNVMGAPASTPARSLHSSIPVARTPADILCLALYALAGGRVLRGFMVSTIADRLGIDFYRATEMADAAHAAGLVRHEHGTVVLTGDGQARAATLTPPAVKKSAGLRRQARQSAPQAMPRPRRRSGKP